MTERVNISIKFIAEICVSALWEKFNHSQQSKTLYTTMAEEIGYFMFIRIKPHNFMA